MQETLIQFLDPEDPTCCREACACAPQLLSLCSRILGAVITEPTSCSPEAHVPQGLCSQEKFRRSEKPTPAPPLRIAAALCKPVQQQRPSTPKNKITFKKYL